MTRLLFGLFTFAFSTMHGQTWKQYHDSSSLYWDKDWIKTEALLQLALEHASSLSYTDEHYLNIVNDLSITHWQLNNIEQSTFYLSLSMQFHPQPESLHQKELFLVMADLASHYLQYGNLNQTKKIHSAILSYNVSTVGYEMYYSTAHKLMDVYEQCNEPDSALMLWNKIDKQHPPHYKEDLSIYITWKMAHARLNQQTNNHVIARKILQELKDLLASERVTKKHSVYYLQMLSALGSIYLEEENLDQALKTLKEAKHLVYNRRDNHPLFSTEIIIKLAKVYEAQEKYKKSISTYREVIALDKALKADHSLSHCRLKHHVANLQFQTGDLIGAIENYEALLNQYKIYIPENDAVFIQVLNNLAHAYNLKKQYHRAYVYLRWAYEVMDTKTTDQSVAATVLNNLADVYIQKGDPYTAQLHREQAHALSTSITH